MSTDYYTPSINILRDFDEDIDYILTPNATKVYNQIVSYYQKGSRSFNLIGSYGTGKSSFVLALEKSLNNQASYFEKGKVFKGIDSFNIINFVGDHDSLISVFADFFGLKGNKFSTKDIISQISNYQGENKSQGLIIVIDEFGKFLEYAASNNPEQELYFIQQLAELANDKTKEILFITILHQNFNAYAYKLTQTQIEEWDKVKGRLIEINFNEPVEQILYLTSQKISDIFFGRGSKNNISLIHDAIKSSNLLPVKGQGLKNYSYSLFPFDLLAAAILALSLQEYGQNERSLFTFISNDEDFGLKKYDTESNPFYNLSCVFDYLNFYHHSFLTTKYNPHLNQWIAIKDSIERAEIMFSENMEEAIKLIKSIGLLNIFSNKGGVINDEFINAYGKTALGIGNPVKVVNELVNQKIIRYSNYDKRYKILKGTDLDFEIAINEAGRLVEKVKDVSSHLNKYFNFPILPAKRVSFAYGTPRIFSFILSSEPKLVVPQDEIDGYINLIFSTDISSEKVRAISSESREALLFGLFKKTERIENTVYEIEKIKKVIEINSEDIVAVQELNNILDHYKSLLNHYVIESLYSDDGSVEWYFNGEYLRIKSHRQFNNHLSRICEEVYHGVPFFQNELVNKSKLSGTISSARKNFISSLIGSKPEINLGFQDTKFPPEKTIFLSLLKSTGIYKEVNNQAVLSAPDDHSFIPLWQICLEFLDKSKEAPSFVSDLVQTLKKRPFKLKQGFIDFWIPVFLIINKDDLALYSKDRVTGELSYIPSLNLDVFELIKKSPKDYCIKKFEFTTDKLKVFNKYREVLNQIEQNRFTNLGFIETFKPFMVFYKSLVPYSQNTKNLSRRALRLRSAISQAIDPEKAFFEDIPKALGIKLNELIERESAIEDYAIALKETIQEINSAYDNLVNDVESHINMDILGEELIYPKNKLALQNRYSELKTELLRPEHSVFYKRITTVLDDRKSWINSLCQVILGKSLESIADDEIPFLKNKISERINELDNYTDLSKSKIDINKEEVIKLEVTSILKGLSKKHIRIPKSKLNEITNLEKIIKRQLRKNDSSFNIALLTRLLQDEINGNEKN